jgi:hypothetical protein
MFADGLLAVSLIITEAAALIYVEFISLVAV